MPWVDIFRAFARPARCRICLYPQVESPFLNEFVGVFWNPRPMDNMHALFLQISPYYAPFSRILSYSPSEVDHAHKRSIPPTSGCSSYLAVSFVGLIVLLKRIQLNMISTESNEYD